MMFFQLEKPRPKKKTGSFWESRVFLCCAACKDRIISYQGLGGESYSIYQLPSESMTLGSKFVGTLIFCWQRKSKLIFGASI